MVAMPEDAYAADGSAAREQWSLDNWDAVSAHIGAARLNPASFAIPSGTKVQNLSR